MQQASNLHILDSKSSRRPLGTMHRKLKLPLEALEWGLAGF